MWTSLGSTSENLAPSSRNKHSATLLGSHVYLFGGRNGNLPLKDLWQYNITEAEWVQLKPSGDHPPCLQEHSAVAYKDCIYVFGGEIGFSAGTETPLWIYNVKENSWKKIRGQKGVSAPKGRRGHSALVYKGSMIIYGGYQDLRGSSNELWCFHFETETWHLLSPKSLSDSLQRPSGRHKHSAVLHDGAMWIYGGMTDLQEKGDLWRWDIASKLWYNIKTKTNPGLLHSHAVCKLPSSMLIFGGESNGQLSNDLWRFHFGTEMWEKLLFPGNKPHPRAESIALIVSEFLFKEKPDHPKSENETDSTTKAFATSKKSMSSKNFNHNKIGPVQKKPVFNECSKNYTSGGLVSNLIQNNNLNFLKEISKLSSINLSRLNHKCSYSVLNSSHDSMESLFKGKESSDSEHTPTRLVKSQSANLIGDNRKKKMTTSALTPAIDKIPYSIVESREFLETDLDKSTKTLMSREGVSVPNLKDFILDTSDPDSTNADKMLNLESIENVDLSNTKTLKYKDWNLNNTNQKNNSVQQINHDNNKINLPGTVVPNVKKVSYDKSKNSSNYSFSERCQSDSYSSHLVMLGNEENTNWKERIPKSASTVRFKKKSNLSEDLTSDYCSIETVNKISSSSNYSQSPETLKELYNDYPELKFGKSTDSSIKKSCNNRDKSYGFSNPNYLEPEAQIILNSKDTQNYAMILNSPSDSVLEETPKSISKPNNENLEMKNMATNKSKQIELKISRQLRSPPRYLPLRGSPYNSTTVPISLEKRKMFRGDSSVRADRQEVYASYLQRSINEEFSTINLEPGVSLSIFLIGGKESGQVPIFRRPISLWKLRLSSNVY